MLLDENDDLSDGWNILIKKIKKKSNLKFRLKKSSNNINQKYKKFIFLSELSHFKILANFFCEKYISVYSR